jgi:hypothetical protein
MGLLERLLNALGIDRLWQLLLDRFPILSRLLDLAKRIISHFTGVFQAAVDLFNSAQTEFDAWRHFRQDVRFTQRVIQVERAIQKTTDLLTSIKNAWQEIIKLIRSAGTELETGGAAEVAEAATGVGLPLAVVNAIVLIVEILDTVRNLIDTAQDIVNVVIGFRELLEGDLIFLQQKNPRRVEKLEDGSSIKIRVGNLHS